MIVEGEIIVSMTFKELSTGNDQDDEFHTFAIISRPAKIRSSLSLATERPRRCTHPSLKSLLDVDVDDESFV